MLLRGSETTRLTHLHEANGCLYNYFGRGPALEVDVKHFDLEAWDRILLVSDGVTKVFHIPEAVQVIQSFEDPGEATKELALRSRGKGSPDDITVVLIEVSEI
jgi:serine/threonine protein phosphatase PrpC